MKSLLIWELQLIREIEEKYIFIFVIIFEKIINLHYQIKLMNIMKLHELDHRIGMKQQYKTEQKCQQSCGGHLPIS